MDDLQDQNDGMLHSKVLAGASNDEHELWPVNLPPPSQGLVRPYEGKPMVN